MLCPPTIKPGMLPLLFFNLKNGGLTFRSLAIFEDQEQINRKVLARYSDVSEKQFSSLGANRERIKGYLEEALSRGEPK